MGCVPRRVFRIIKEVQTSVSKQKLLSLRMAYFSSYKDSTICSRISGGIADDRFFAIVMSITRRSPELAERSRNVVIDDSYLLMQRTRVRLSRA